MLNVILDSGAYTAWRSGKPINLLEYCDFIKRNQAWITSYANLDVINQNDPEQAAHDSHENYKFMRAQGLKPMPIFHVGEDSRWLKTMLDAGCDYIGLSASSLVSRNKVDSWYDMIWEHIVSPSGLPLVKAHAFGEGREGSLIRNPWYSADSASWIYSSMRSATIQINSTVRLSHRRDQATKPASQDVDALVGADAEVWQSLLAEYGIREDALTRDAAGSAIRLFITAKHYLRIEARVSSLCPIRVRTNGFFSQSLGIKKQEPIHIPKFNMHFVIGGNNIAAAVVALTGAQNVLVSYPYLSGNKSFPLFEKFVNAPLETVMSEKKYLRGYNQIKDCLTHA